jgi:hypothetical protein
MAITYPTSLDAFTNPTSTDLLTSPSHSQQHSDINDAVEALEAKVAIGNTVLGTYTSYTPTLTAITIGNGTLTGQYARVNDFVHVTGSFTLGSTSAITGSIGISPPVNIHSSMGYAASPLGLCNLYDTSSGAMNNLQLLWTSATEMRVRAINTAGAYSIMVVTSATVPLTWAVGDILTWQATYRAA